MKSRTTQFTLVSRLPAITASITLCLLLWFSAGPGAPSGQAAASYPFPSRAEDLAPGHYWYFSDIHAGGSKALDLVGVRFDAGSGKWVRHRENTPDPNKLENDDSIIYNTPVRAIADGEVIACWRNAPENLRPGEPHPGRTSTPKTISRSANFLVVKSANENKTALYAHLKPGTVPPGLCPYNAQFMQNADDKEGGDYPVEAIVPVGKRAKVKQGQVIGRVGNAGASSGPHLHIDMSNVTGENEEGPSLPINFHGAWVKSILAPQDVTTDWERLAGAELTTPKTAILPDYSKGFPEIAKHGVPAGDYQFVFDHITKSGYRLEWVDGFNLKGKVYFNAIFRPGAGGDWAASHNLDGAQYQAEFDKRKSQGFSLAHVDSYPAGNRILYAAIFVKGGPAITAYHGIPADDHQKRFDQLTAGPWRPKNLSVVSLGGERFYTALYVKADIGGYEARSFLTPAEYQKLFDENKQKGRQLAYLNAYEHNGQPRFTAIWNSSTQGAFKARHGLSGGEYQAEWGSALKSGMLTRAVTGYTEGGAASYAAVWRK